MRIVLDTNVFVSAVFFGGPPRRILEGWRDGEVRLVLSIEILDEYQRVGAILRSRYRGVELDPILVLVAAGSEVVEAPGLPERVVSDPDDDKFFACAVAANIGIIVSGDRGMQRASGWGGVRVLSPRRFVDEVLT